MGKLIVWYDGGCPLCCREIAFMRRLDRRHAIEFSDVSIPGVECTLDRGALLSRFHVRENGRVLSGAAAFAAMWRAIPWLRPFGLVARIPVVLAGLERVYAVFLRVRPRLQRVAARLERLPPVVPRSDEPPRSVGVDDHRG